MERYLVELRSLSRRDLQARAKELGVRANGKSVEIIEAVARLLYDGSKVETDEQHHDLEHDDPEHTETQAHEKHMGGVPEAADAAVDGQPEAVDAGSQIEQVTVDAAQQNVKPAVDSPSSSPPPGDAEADTAETTATGPDSQLVTPARQRSAMEALHAYQELPAIAPTPSLANRSRFGQGTSAYAAQLPLEDLAAKANASLLAVKLTGMRLDSPFHASMRAGVTSAREWQGYTPGAATEESPYGSDSAVLSDAETEGVSVEDPDPTDLMEVPEDCSVVEATQRLTFCAALMPATGRGGGGGGSSTEFQARLSSASCMAVVPGAADGSVNAVVQIATINGDSGAPQDGAVAEQAGSVTGSHSFQQLGRGVGDGSYRSNSSAHPQSHNKSQDQEQLGGLALPAPEDETPKLTFAPRPTSDAVGVTTPKLFGRPGPQPGAKTPAPAMAHITDRTPLRQLRMAEVLQPGTGTAAATPGAGSGRAGGAPPRTPGTSLRTPARRVPVCTDVAQARLAEEWVEQHLFHRGGVDASEPSGISWQSLEGLDAAKQKLQALVCPSATPYNAAVLLYGPPGIGKSTLAQAFATELGAAYLHLAPELASKAAAAGGAEVAVRAAFRVASRSACPVVMHVEDVEQLVGGEVAKQIEARRRLRTELQVGVDELLLQNPVAPSPSSSVAAGPSAARPGVHVVVVSTTSRPMGLDDTLAASLGRTGRIMVGLPDEDTREMYLVGRLSALGAALGLQQMERLISKTAGLSCTDLAALCDQAAQLAAARQRSGTARGTAAVVDEKDLQQVLSRMGPRISAEELAELKHWHARPLAARGWDGFVAGMKLQG